MADIRIVTDSTMDLDKRYIEQYGITVVPLKVIIDGESYRERIDLTADEFYRKLSGCDALPTTSQPSPADFVETYRQLKAEGADHIISIHLSSEFSGTYQGAVLAKSMVAQEIEVDVIDSRTATAAIGMIVLAAARAIEEGKSIEEVRALIDQVSEKLQLYFLVDSLDNLQKGGRIGTASYLVGSLLNIKPILSVANGVVNAYEKVRGKDGRALERLLDIVVGKVDQHKKVYCAIGYCDDIEIAKKVEEKLRDRLSLDEVVYVQVGCVIGTHTGLGAVGVAFYQLD